MDIFLIVIAIVLFIFGALLFFKPGIEKKISDWLNKNMLLVEDGMRSSNKISGLLLIALGIVICYLVVKK